MPVNLRDHSTTANAVEPAKTMVDFRRHEELHRPPWESSKYQPRINITAVNTRNGHVSTRNAGAAPSPAEVPPNKPSRPGTTHHQGKGSNPLNDATNGFSTCSILRMSLIRFS